jgi:hypothetical protein
MLRATSRFHHRVIHTALVRFRPVWNAAGGGSERLGCASQNSTLGVYSHRPADRKTASRVGRYVLANAIGENHRRETVESLET